MGFYSERDKQAGDSDNPWTQKADFDQLENLGFGEVDAATFSYEDMNLVDQSTVSGDTGPLGGSTPGENPL